jgi:hypothetical protein
MDITVYDKLCEVLNTALTEFNSQTGFNANMAKYAPDEPKYPLLIITEVRNQPKTHFYSTRERTSSIGFKVDIFSKTTIITDENKNKTILDKQQTCRQLMQFVVDFMLGDIGVNLISKNEFDKVGTQGELYQITLVFQQNYLENKEYFI